MICYLIRHGKDDSSVRGGWSDQPLTEEGKLQAAALASHVAVNKDALQIGCLYASDLPRAVQTADPIADALKLPITLLPAFREANNGDLAGMDNTLAKERYPGLFWNTLEWEQKYPGGESPRDFYERIKAAWDELSSTLASREDNAMLITHSGVINIILSLINGLPYSNKIKPRSVPHTTLIALELEDGEWREL